MNINLEIQTLRARDQTRIPREFGANTFSGSEIFESQTKRTKT